MTSNIDGSEINERIKERQEKIGLPLPAKPKGFGKEYDFPEDPNSLQSVELGQLMLRMAGFNGYALRVIGGLEAEQVALEAEYRVAIADAGREIREKMGRVAADTIESLALANSPGLMPLYRRLTEIRVALARMNSLSKIYTSQAGALSRELSRREMDSRVGG